MADLDQKVAENVPGRYFVDATCIDCDLCRELAATTSSARTPKATPTSAPSPRPPRKRPTAGPRWTSVPSRRSGSPRADPPSGRAPHALHPDPHPGVVPFAAVRRWRLPLSALAIGSMVPDLPLFLPGASNYQATHSAPGLITADLPLGLACFLAFQLLFKGFLFALMPHLGPAALRRSWPDRASSRPSGSPCGRGWRWSSGRSRISPGTRSPTARPDRDAVPPRAELPTAFDLGGSPSPVLQGAAVRLKRRRPAAAGGAGLGLAPPSGRRDRSPACRSSRLAPGSRPCSSPWPSPPPPSWSSPPERISRPTANSPGSSPVPAWSSWSPWSVASLAFRAWATPGRDLTRQHERSTLATDSASGRPPLDKSRPSTPRSRDELAAEHRGPRRSVVIEPMIVRVGGRRVSPASARRGRPTSRLRGCRSPVVEPERPGAVERGHPEEGGAQGRRGDAGGGSGPRRGGSASAKRPGCRSRGRRPRRRRASPGTGAAGGRTARASGGSRRRRRRRAAGVVGRGHASRPNSAGSKMLPWATIQSAGRGSGSASR